MTHALHTDAAKAARIAARSIVKNVDELIQEANEDWTPTQTASVRKTLSAMPEGFRATYVKAMEGRSLAAAVKACCSECVGWKRKEVRLCTSLACPLYPYRPYQEHADGTIGVFSIPEPTVLSLLAAGALALMRRRL